MPIPDATARLPLPDWWQALAVRAALPPARPRVALHLDRAPGAPVVGSIEPALAAQLRDAAGDAAVKVLVLTGSGDAFCAGGDVGAMASGNLFAASYEASVDILRQKMEAPRLLHELGKPTIARVRGAAAGAGLSLALACDLRVADDTAQFVTAFAKVGASGDYGGSWFLARLVGVAKAKELYFTSPRVGAREALALGLVNRVVTDGELDAAVDALAAGLAAGPSIALNYMKRNFNAVADGLPLPRLPPRRHRAAACAAPACR